MNILLTKEEVVAQGKLDRPPYSVASEVHKALFRGALDNIHIPHSDVYYVRESLHKHTGYYFPLDVVEKAMKAEGWRDRQGKKRY